MGLMQKKPSGKKKVPKLSYPNSDQALVSPHNPVWTPVIQERINGYKQVPYYYNQQFPVPETKCGQAGAFTFVDIYSNVKFVPAHFLATEPASHSDTGPDVLGHTGPGAWGTSAGRIRHIIEKHMSRQSVNWWTRPAGRGGMTHDTAFRYMLHWVQAGHPCLVLLDFGNFTAHWTVVYAFNSNQDVFITNWEPNRISKSTFIGWWKEQTLTSAAGMGSAFYYCAGIRPPGLSLSTEISRVSYK
jgi:hypothetical protein